MPALPASEAAPARGPAVVVTRADLKQSLNAFSSLLKEGKAFRQALMGLATAASSFASALESASVLSALPLTKAARQGMRPTKGGFRFDL
jgi:hypothetical protein